MIRSILIVFAAVCLIGCNDPVYASGKFSETRYCGKPERSPSGKIKRSAAATQAFKKLYPLPAGYDRADWSIDHVIPLTLGGCDAVRNMQWMPPSGKSCAEDYCKDRYERVIYPQKL